VALLVVALLAVALLAVPPSRRLMRLQTRCAKPWSRAGPPLKLLSKERTMQHRVEMENVMQGDHPVATTQQLQTLRQLVLKRGVGLGLLPADQRTLVFALAWAALPEGGFTEPQVNHQLKCLLQGPVAFLHTDHVELRRWLVDAQWLDRDGYGREYRRRAALALPESGRALALELQSLDAAAWVAHKRQAHDSRRTAQRQAWEAQQAHVQAPSP